MIISLFYVNNISMQARAGDVHESFEFIIRVVAADRYESDRNSGSNTDSILSAFSMKWQVQGDGFLLPGCPCSDSDLSIRLLKRRRVQRTASIPAADLV